MIFLVMQCVMHLGRAPGCDIPRLVPGAAGVPHPIIVPEKGEGTRFARSRTFGDHTGTWGGVRGKGLGEVDESVGT